MFPFNFTNSFDASKSTKGASKLRRDLINSEIANLRDLLPLPSSTRQRLSQLQLMALVCVYVRKANYFHYGMRQSSSSFSYIHKRANLQNMLSSLTVHGNSARTSLQVHSQSGKMRREGKLLEKSGPYL